MTLPRGLRNKNPGNIEKGSSWAGLAKKQTDSRFCTFISYEYGCRALLKLLVTYVNKYKCTSIISIIDRYAPSCENDTKSYIHAVTSSLNIEPSDKITFNRDIYIKLAKAIAHHENGSDADLILTDDIWNTAADLANL